MENIPFLEIDRLVFRYSGSNPVFEQASLTVESGTFSVIRGVSGSGKSTLLRLLCRLEEPDSGDIRFEGASISSIEPMRLRREICYVQQTPTLMEGSIRDNLLLPFSFKINTGRTLPSDEAIQSRLDDFLLQGVDLTRPALNLSVGQRQRVCLLRAMLLQPRIMLLDEPTSALDSERARIVLSIVETLNQTYGITILLVTHDTYMPENVQAILLLCENGGIRRI